MIFLLNPPCTQPVTTLFSSSLLNPNSIPCKYHPFKPSFTSTCSNAHYSTTSLKPMNTFLLSLPLFLTLLLHLVAPSKEDSIYDVLKKNGLPIGLLPKGVTNFVVDSDGNFEVHLDQACNAKFESELHYDRNVSGIIKFGQIGALNGVSAQELFLWFPVKGIRVDIPSSGLIYFDVGVVSKQFALSMFESPRDCMAVRDHVLGDVSDGTFIARAVSKSRNGELSYRLDQGKFGRGVL